MQGKVLVGIQLLNLSGNEGGITCWVNGGLNGTGGFVDGCASTSPITYTKASYSDVSKAGILDGVFSIWFTSFGYEVDGLPFVVGIKNGVRTAMLFADGSVRTAVPEPGVFALLCAGLAGLGLSRRRRVS